MTGIPQSEIYETSVSFILQGVATRQTFPVTSMECRRMQDVLEACDGDEAVTKQFLVFGTTNGWTVAVCIAAIEAVYVLGDPIDHAPEYERADPLSVRCHFGETGESLRLSPPYAREVAALALDLDCGLETIPRRFVSITDEDDELLYIGVAHIRLIQMSTALVTAGHAAIRADMDAGRDAADG